MPSTLPCGPCFRTGFPSYFFGATRVSCRLSLQGSDSSSKLKKTTFWVAKAAAQERDYTATGCQNPATQAAPAGCVKATLPPWSVSSVIVRIKR